MFAREPDRVEWLSVCSCVILLLGHKSVYTVTLRPFGVFLQSDKKKTSAEKIMVCVSNLI